jgi:RNA polymerase sigma-70 factor (ECF subfamily)
MSKNNLEHEDSSSLRLSSMLARVHEGDATALNELLAHTAERMRALARLMLRDFPIVRRFEETDDVYQAATLRLFRALTSVELGSGEDFFRLAALQIRRELFDLARRYSGPAGLGANHPSQTAPDASDGMNAWEDEVSDLTHEPSQLASWTEFHNQVERLAREEREVFDLIYYLGLSQPEVASLLGISERTVRSRWRKARLDLMQKLGNRLPGS